MRAPLWTERQSLVELAAAGGSWVISFVAWCANRIAGQKGQPCRESLSQKTGKEHAGKPQANRPKAVSHPDPP